MTDEMLKQKGLLVRENGLYFQVRIPKDIQHHFPKVILREKLDTFDPAEAAVMVRKRLAEMDEVYARIRATGTKLKQTITDLEAEGLIALSLHSRLAADEETRSEGVEDWLFNDMESWTQEAEASEKAAVSRGKLDPRATSIVSDWLAGHDYDIPEDSPEFRRFAIKFLKAHSAATEAIKTRSAGIPVDTPPPPREKPVESTQGGHYLGALVDLFLENADSTKPMYIKYRTVLNLFRDVVGNKRVDQLKQIDIETFLGTVCRLPPRWDAAIKARGISVVALAKEDHPKTIAPKTYDETYVGALSPFLNWCQRVYGDQGFPRHLTTKGIKYRGNRKSGEDRQRPMTEAEIKALFGSAYMAEARASTETEHKFWFPLVGLYTGARVNEVCQLNPQTDIREEFGIWVFDFTEESETDERVQKSVKNDTSRRTVPIHQKLIDLGFLEYVKRIQDSGSKLLFPQWPPIRGKASGMAERFFREVLVELGLKDETPGKTLKGYHAFRHTMENRALNLEVDNIRLIVGHAGMKTTVERGYEGQAGLELKKRILGRIWFDLGIN